MRGSEFMELRALMAIAECGNFARAAARLALTPSALSQTIKSLEQRHGVRLLNRTTRSVAATEAGAALIARLHPLLAELDSAVADLASHSRIPRGTLRINAPRLAALHLLAPQLAGFMARYPEIELEIVSEEGLIDIVSAGYDAGIRLGEKLHQNMIAIPLGGEVQMRVVASPQYLAQNGCPQHPAELHQHRCLSYFRPSDRTLWRWEFEKNGKKLEVDITAPLRVNEPELLVAAVKQGAGISYLFGALVDEAIADGDLVPILNDWTPPFAGYSLYYPGNTVVPTQLRALIDYLRETR